MKKLISLPITVSVSAVLLAALRIFQQVAMTDPATGFWWRGFELVGNVTVVLMLVAVVAVLIASRVATRSQAVSLPEGSRLLAVVTALLAVVVLLDGAAGMVSGGAFGFIMLACAVAAAVSLGWYACSLCGIATLKPAALLGCSAFSVLSLTEQIIGFVGQVTVANSMFAMLAASATALYLVALPRTVYRVATGRVGRGHIFAAAASVMLGLLPMTVRIGAALGGVSYNHPFNMSEVTAAVAAVHAVCTMLYARYTPTKQ